MKYHLQLEYLKKELEECEDFSVRKAFKAIDDLSFKFINEQNLKHFLYKMGH